MAKKKTTTKRTSKNPDIAEVIGKAVEKEIRKEFAKKREPSKTSTCCNIATRSTCGGIYGLGFVGALIYYISTATGFWVGVLGILKAIVWPAILVFKLLVYLT
ncbi:MAG: hypothetical protein ACOCWQ_04005 [Nanoarchaeota archaeon]